MAIHKGNGPRPERKRELRTTEGTAAFKPGPKKPSKQAKALAAMSLPHDRSRPGFAAMYADLKARQ